MADKLPDNSNPDPVTPETVEPERDLVGSIYRVPDNWWGFQVIGREEHPGACIQEIPGTGQVILVKGTDPQSARHKDAQVEVEPNDENGLKKPTTFAIRPFTFSARRVALLHFDRLVGQLDEDDLKNMQLELLRLYAEEDENSDPEIHVEGFVHRESIEEDVVSVDVASTDAPSIADEVECEETGTDSSNNHTQNNHPQNSHPQNTHTAEPAGSCAPDVAESSRSSEPEGKSADVE